MLLIPYNSIFAQVVQEGSLLFTFRNLEKLLWEFRTSAYSIYRRNIQGLRVLLGFNPVWNETLQFSVKTPQLVVMRFAVYDSDLGSDEFLAQHSIPLRCMRQGKLTFCLSFSGMLAKSTGSSLKSKGQRFMTQRNSTLHIYHLC